MKSSRRLVSATAALALSLAGSVGSAVGASSGDGIEQVVISIKTNPVMDPEPSCVALQIGINLLLATVPVGERPVSVTPADRVVLFPTVDGVELVNPNNQINKRKRPKLVCDTPNGENTASLAGLLQNFVNLGGEVLICPLCANSRGITDPTQGTNANAEQIHNLFLFADKVIDF
ncbi:MAG: DsrE family protein [Gammaproteobacteria bacterium]